MMFVPAWARATVGIEAFAGGVLWLRDEDAATRWLRQMRDNITEGHCWVIRNRLLWEGETIDLGDVFQVIGQSLPEIPLTAARLHNPNRMVLWKEEQDRVASQFQIEQAKVLLRIRSNELQEGKVRINAKERRTDDARVEMGHFDRDE
jgi:phage terminase Nu1 subunit (DNA packaging protein)